ncbi:hypothetical protein P3S67_025130 [Capsicum chacoense]
MKLLTMSNDNLVPLCRCCMVQRTFKASLLIGFLNSLVGQNVVADDHTIPISIELS